MTRAFDIRSVRSAADVAAAAELFEAYAASLPIDLGYQDFDSELAGLPGKYAPPRGELLLARDREGASLGCVGLRQIASKGCCEMKRLYLSPDARGLGLGRALTETVIAAARRLGYAEMRLDTLPTMEAAIGLYQRLGFSSIDPYYAPTPVGTVFMALKL